MGRDEPDGEAGRLYDQLGAPLYRYALMIVGSREPAEDMVQQVFVSFLARGSRGVDDPEHYLRRAVRNACFSWLRQRRSDGIGVGDPERLLELVPSEAAGVGEEMRLALSTAIAQLSAEQREVIHLHAFEGRTFRDIAAITNTPQNTVASRYRYALERLRVVLEERGR